jgi:hypothetical protein
LDQAALRGIASDEGRTAGSAFEGGFARVQTQARLREARAMTAPAFLFEDTHSTLG